mmetsp:Transcript_21523/g.44293  ORF Transcript_21523/g.44293 Transcript_21523/m.44293 type:complete len:524 (+) Transcript_21523:349-1920(+)
MPRRSTRRSTSPVPDDNDGSGASESEPSRRVSSRATKFAKSMKEPKNSIDDILPPNTPDSSSKAKSRGGGRASKKRRTSRNDSDDDSDDAEMVVESSSEEDGSDDEDEEEEVIRPSSTRTRSNRSSAGRRAAAAAFAPGSPAAARSATGTSRKLPKSPAVRHKTRRRTVRTEIPVESDYDEESGEEEASSDEEEEDGDEDDDEEEEIKIQRIIASRSETRKRWREICGKMNTSEVDNGSRWFQDAGDGNSDDDNVFEERFLVKWTNLSFLHCSWEGQDDLIAQVDNAKTYLTTFFRKSENGLLFDADERGDGEFFDPRYVQIERILEVVIDSEDDDEDEGTGTGSSSNNNKKNASTEGGENNDVVVPSPIEEYGIVLDKDDPNFEDGTGRQFLVKWDNAAYSDCTYEFERDLILNDVEYEEHLASFLRRSKKPTKAEMTEQFSRQEEQRRRLYKIFGDKAKGSGEEKDEKIKEYQQKLQDHVFVNGGQVRDYQAEGISWMISNYINKRSSILADEVSNLMTYI